jgi:hypothetical protein
MKANGVYSVYIFTDFETNNIFSIVMDKFYKDHPDKNYYHDLLTEEFKITSGQHPRSRDLGNWDNHLPKKGDSHNLIMFASGWPDGSYPTYWGHWAIFPKENSDKKNL